MPVRKARTVRRIWDEVAQPRRQLEVVAATEHATAVLLAYEWDPTRPDHGEGAALTGEFAVMPHTGTAAEPVWLLYDRGLQPRPWRVGDRRFRSMGDAMEAAVGY
jgi:hypothetical protein